MGNQGSVGNKGPVGNKGLAGEPGPAGPAGPVGTSVVLAWDPNGSQLEQFENNEALADGSLPLRSIRINDFESSDDTLPALLLHGSNPDAATYMEAHERTALHVRSGTTTCRSLSAAATLTVVNDYKDTSSGDQEPNVAAAIDIRSAGFKAAGIKYFFPPNTEQLSLRTGMSLSISKIAYDKDSAGNLYPNVYFEFV